MIKHPFEIIVVGSGATGGVAALTFAEAGVRVLVVEAGPQLTVEQALGSEPANTFNRIKGIISGEKRIQAQHPGYWKANPSLYANEKDNSYTYPPEKPYLWTQGRQVGGKSLTWGGITLRLSEDDLKASKRDGYGPDWPIEYAELAPHYSALEKRLRVHGQRDGLTQLPDGEFIDPLPFTTSEEIFGRTVKSKLGYPFIHSRGFGHHEPNKANILWPRSSSPGSTLQSALATGKVEVLPDHIVEKIIMKQGHDFAKGVLVINQKDGKRTELNSSLIVICASTIQSLRLLLNSEKSQQVNGFVDPSCKLGSHLMDHISICRFFAFPVSQSQASSTNYKQESKILSGAGSFFIPFGTKFIGKSKINFKRGYGIWGGIDRFEPPKWLKKIPESNTGFLIAHGEVLPYPNNKVTLSNKLDRWGIPLPHINCNWGKNEEAMAEHMKMTIQEIIKAADGKVLPIKELIKIPFIEFFLNNAVALKEEVPPPGYYIHEVGGAPMGTCEENSVLDRFNRLWRCKNVLVVDGACWPTSGWQSPTLTMMAITRRACLEALNHQGDQKGR
ncbi:GMC family oxidoreductase [Prochlorococcus sp. MIT 1307]|uniref:GMC family oxidoreductase n=1 Tax=Prochlorococcus sp. MIT 1307 TaxID=3096219 RepID=UPI002A75A57E|nr:GMC family oxidoreductase [Prochlorococcus sp. MIT 1307]